MRACVKEVGKAGGKSHQFWSATAAPVLSAPSGAEGAAPLETPEASSGVGVGWLFRAERTTTAPPARRKEWTRLVLKGFRSKFRCQLTVRRPAGDLTDLERRSGPITSARS